MSPPDFLEPSLLSLRSIGDTVKINYINFLLPLKITRRDSKLRTSNVNIKDLTLFEYTIKTLVVKKKIVSSFYPYEVSGI